MVSIAPVGVEGMAPVMLLPMHHFKFQATRFSEHSSADPEGARSFI